ncbi:MAG: GTPase Era, partial [Caulobacterales bacterium]|nr:GTPase Era [Caulobacterales bacterium]
KSTLVNRLVGCKVTIVTHKVQTTRFAVRGVIIRDASQVVLVDTPGVFAPRRRLDRAMVRAAWDGAAGADLAAHVVDAAAEDRARRGGAKQADQRASDDAGRVTEGLLSAGAPAVLILNKVDLLARERLLALAESLHASGAYGEVFMISAETGSGVDDLAAALAGRMPEGPWLYPEDQIADLPERLLAAEITREKVFLRLHQELPYHATVETDAWSERKDGSVRIDQTLYVERDSQRKIALGKGGATIKAIGQAAREELERLLERRAHLFLHVKVRERWMDDRARYAALGLEFGE